MPGISRKDIEGRAQIYLRTAGGTRPDLAVVEVRGRRLVVKDFRRSDFLFRHLIGPLLIGRECKALARLDGVDGIPALVGRIDRFAFAAEYIPGTSLDKLSSAQLSASFFDRLAETVKEMHSRGVAHCDMRSRGNVILAEDDQTADSRHGRPYIVDFAACVMRGRGLNPLVNWLFARFCEADDDAVLRIKKRLAPDLLTVEEEHRLARRNPLERPAQMIGRGVRRITRMLLTKRTRR